MHFLRHFPSLCHFLGMLSLTVAVLLATGRGVTAAGRPKGNNICTRVKSAIEVHRIPIPGTKTQIARYTTMCGLQGRCSRYRIVYVQNYREVTRTIYRVVQECCAGWVQSGRRCVTAPAPDTAAGTGMTLVPDRRVTGGTENKATENPSKQSPTWPNVATGNGVPGTGTDVEGVGGRETDGRRKQGFDAVPTGGGRGEGGSVGTGQNNKPGRTDTDGTSNTKTDEGVLQDGAMNNYPVDEEFDPATPEVQLPQKDSGMMFLTGMLCGVGVLSVAAFVVLFLMYRQRRNLDGRVMGIPFLQSTRFGSGSFRKSKLLALAQSIKSGEVKLIRESTTTEKAKGHSQYADIEEMQKGITFNKSSEPLPSMATKQAKDKTPSIKLPKVVALNASSNWTPLQNERQLPPKPPAYTIVQRVDLKGKAPEIPGNGVEDPAVDLGYSTVYATPDSVPKGTCYTIPREFNMGPPRYILCESQHIYADIHRKSKASTWSCSKNSRPKSSASTGDRPRREGSRSARTLSRTLSRNSLGTMIKRGSNAGSSGYSSLRGSRENIFDTYASVEERSGPPSPNIYSETVPKDIGISEHYDKLDLSQCDSFKTEYDKLSRGPKTSGGNGIVKTFSKKYEKLASMSMSKR